MYLSELQVVFIEISNCICINGIHLGILRVLETRNAGKYQKWYSISTILTEYIEQFPVFVLFQMSGEVMMYLGKLLFGYEAILVDVKESESDVGRVLSFPSLCCVNLLEASYWPKSEDNLQTLYIGNKLKV